MAHRTRHRTTIAALKPKAKRFAVADPELPSFYVRITPAGAKSYIAMATDPRGKQIGTTIGTGKQCVRQHRLSPHRRALPVCCRRGEGHAARM